MAMLRNLVETLGFAVFVYFVVNHPAVILIVLGVAGLGVLHARKRRRVSSVTATQRQR